MATVDSDGARRQKIIAALAEELRRQNIGSADLEALADAIQKAVGATPDTNEGRRPDELNATNDG